MSWTSLYRVALRILPARLRHKHGRAMESLFAHELGRARERGRVFGALAGAAGLWDVVERGAYERVRTVRDFLRVLRGDQPEGSSPSMPLPTTPQLLRRLAFAFAISSIALTGTLAFNAARRIGPPSAQAAASSGTLVEVLLFTLPHTVALTIPMAVFISVLWVFTRLGAEGTLAAARLQRDGLRRLVAPVLGAAIVVAGVMLVWNAEVVPRANERLVEVLTNREPVAPRGDRLMTLGELRVAVRSARSDVGPRALERAAAYELEVQKKYALAAASFVLALAAAAIALRFPRGRAGLVVGASCAVFWGYWVSLIAGENLADQLTVSPFVAMWTANGLLLAAALLVVWRTRPRFTMDGTGPLVISE